MSARGPVDDPLRDDAPSASTLSPVDGIPLLPETTATAPVPISDLPTLLAGDPRLAETMPHPGSGTGVTLGVGLAVAGLGALVGARWGDFELGELLGQGGMGAVYRGRQISLDRAVAIKVLPPPLAERAELRERFMREARAIAPVASPHVVQVIHAGTYEGWYFYAMELVDGEDLARRLRGGWRPTVAEARDLIAQAARGLAAAARFAIVHRDIKPANMLITGDGVLKLSDFGLVRRTGEKGLTVNGQVMGTTSYLSPEQAEGRVCDARSDLYALGIVFYELLAGRVPFAAETAAGVIYQHVHAVPEPVTRFNPQVDAATAAICAKLLAKDPAARYQAAADLIIDLGLADAGRPLRFARARRSHRPLLVAALAVALLAGGAWAWARHAAAAAAARDIEAQAAAARAEQERAAAAAAAAREAAHRDAAGRFADLPIPGAPLRLREIPPGEGRIGSLPDEKGRERDETLVSVRFSRRFWIGDSEVTQAQWRAVMGEPPTQPAVGDDLPVVGIEPAQAEAFCSRLGVLLAGVAARLPSEAEWEYAARAGAPGAWSGGRPLATQGWFADNSGGRMHPVKQFPANPWGLHDIHGNVAEWTADAYLPRTATPLVDPAPVVGNARALVVKGGAADDSTAACRLASRVGERRAHRAIGFRVLVTELPDALR